MSIDSRSIEFAHRSGPVTYFLHSILRLLCCSLLVATSSGVATTVVAIAAVFD